VKKKICEDERQFDAVVTLAARGFSAEEQVAQDSFVEIQKIGQFLRVLKASDGKDSFTELPLTPHYQQMAEECAKLFDGIDFFTIRLAHSKSSDQEVILDVQDYSRYFCLRVF